MKKLLPLIIGLCALFGATQANAANCGAAATACFWVGGTGTWDGSTNAHWANSSGGTGGCGVGTCGPPADALSNVTFDANSISGATTVTVNTNPTIQILTLTGYTGTLDFSANNNNISLYQITDTSGANTLNCGTGTWTVTGSNATWNTQNGSMTLICASAAITFNNTSPSGIRGFTTTSGQSFGAVTFIGTATLANNYCVYGASGAQTITFASLSFTNINCFSAAGGSTITLGAAPTWTGTSSSPIAFTQANIVSSTTNMTIALPAGAGGNPTINWATFNEVSFTGGSSPQANNSVSGARVSGITVNPPTGGSRGIIGG